MKYNISDIVKAAKQIADIENSDFISWNENIRLLNEAWTAVIKTNKQRRLYICK